MLRHKPKITTER